MDELRKTMKRHTTADSRLGFESVTSWIRYHELL